jgi:pimeloyl-ACP methyl ester carboxylesterase
MTAMSSFVLIPGAGGSAWYWHRVVPLLEAAGHTAIAVDLPGDDPEAGLDEYAEIVVRAAGDRQDVVLVAQSLGGFTAPLVCARVPVRMLIFVNAMIPLPGETPGAWWGNTGSEQARREAARRHGYAEEFDLDAYFLHDVAEEVVKAGADHQRAEVEAVFKSPCRFEAWPAVPRHVIAGTADRFFPLELQARIARERLGVDVQEVSGGHLVALSNPGGLSERLIALSRGA